MGRSTTSRSPAAIRAFGRRRATLSKAVSVGNAEFEASRALEFGYEALGPGQVAAVTTPTFSPREMLNMRTYDLMATPLVYPGQTVKARVAAPTATVAASRCVCVFGSTMSTTNSATWTAMSSP